jgi:hypothetical protein
MTGLAVHWRVDRRLEDHGPGVGGVVPRRLRRGRWSTPGRVFGGVAVVAVLACCLGAASALTAGQAADEFTVIGQRDAPESNATTGLYFSLNDMDAQVANVLLVGGNASLAADRTRDLATYSADRTTADQDLQQATAIEAGNPAAQRTLTLVLNRIGQYEALATDALLTGQATRSATGRAPAAAIAYYRQATTLMQTGILPSVTALTNDSSAELAASYAHGQDAARAGIAAAAAGGLALITSLVGLQLYLAARYRRRVNPALASATLVAIALVTVTVGRLDAQSGHLTVAKNDAYDSIIALTQARAVSYNANADESRYLVDPGLGDQYQQAFLTKSQELADVGSVDIDGYDAALASDVTAYERDNADVRFGGYLGAEFRNITFPGERAAAVATLLAYQRYERDDRTLRALAKTNLPAAVGYDIGTARSQSDGTFTRYDAALSAVIAINVRAFTAADTAGEDDSAVWEFGFPAAAVALLGVLLYVGVRPRLREYR